ncbi:hypothetical protein FEP76_06082 [Burkholderia multivorans]|nr:hypothetical protein [Burkholderia multivorans]
MRARDEQREPEALADHPAHHLDRRRREHDVRREPQFVKQADEVGAARLHVEQDHRLDAQVVQRHLRLAREAVVFRQQHVRLLRRHQRLGLDRRVEIVIVEKREIEAAGRQPLHEFLLIAVAQPDVDARIALAKARDQLRQIQRRDRLEAADVDLAGHDVVVRERVLFEFARDAQQFLRLPVEARAARRQRHALRVMADEQHHAEAFLQTLDRAGNRRLRDEQLARRLGDAAGLDRRHEVFQLPQSVVSHEAPLSLGLAPRGGGGSRMSG